MARVHKHNKVFFYLNGLLFEKRPVASYKKVIARLEKRFSKEQLEEIEKEVNYYNKLNEKTLLSHLTQVKDLLHPTTPKAYFFDAYRMARHFDSELYLDYVFGDVTSVPDTPSLVKSRPIGLDNTNSILLKLNHTRHFVRVSKDKPFDEKKDLLIGRGGVYQDHRYRFFEKYYGHPLTDLKQTNTSGGNPEWLGPKISIKAHLDYKFILSLEGNDVASNLKWIMSSNSLAVMPKPKYETWFREGQLIGGKHFVEIKEDYSDLEEKLEYYLSHPQECQEILTQAKKHVAPFYNKRREFLSQLKVLEKYFRLTH